MFSSSSFLLELSSEQIFKDILKPSHTLTAPLWPLNCPKYLQDWTLVHHCGNCCTLQHFPNLFDRSDRTFVLSTNLIIFHMHWIYWCLLVDDCEFLFCFGRGGFCPDGIPVLFYSRLSLFMWRLRSCWRLIFLNGDKCTIEIGFWLLLKPEVPRLEGEFGHSFKRRTEEVHLWLKLRLA